LLSAAFDEALRNVVYGFIMERLREKVKELRKKKGWAQEDLARELDVSLSTVQRWEKRGGRPSRLPRRELARLFKEAEIDSE